MFWKGRKGEKRLLELITVRNYFNCLPEFRKPNEQRKGIGLTRHLKEQTESKQTPQALPNEGCALQEKHLLSAATVSTIYHLNAQCIHGDRGAPDSYFSKAKTTGYSSYFHF